MKDKHAYDNYCAWYKDCAYNDIPPFYSILEAILHYEKEFNGNNLVHGKNCRKMFCLILKMK